MISNVFLPSLTYSRREKMIRFSIEHYDIDVSVVVGGFGQAKRLVCQKCVK